MRASMLILAGMLSACATAQESPLEGTWTATDAERDGRRRWTWWGTA